MSEPEVVESEQWPVRLKRRVMVDPLTLTEHPHNPKIHTAEQDAVVEASLREFGWLQGLLINEVTGHLLNGHERRNIAIRQGQRSVPADMVEIDAADEGKVLLTLDPSGTLYRTHMANWSALARTAQPRQASLKKYFTDLAARHGVAGVGQSVGSAYLGGGAAGPTGTPAGERQAVSGQISGAAARVETLRQEWQVLPGQVWQLGAHVVVCGSVNEAWVWDWLRAEVGPVQGVFTSPPYAEQRKGQYGSVAVDDYVPWFTRVGQRVYEALAEDGSFFVNLTEHSQGVVRPIYVHELIVALVKEAHWVYIDQYCWPRPGVPCDPLQHGKFKNQWEPVFWFGKTNRPVFYPQRAMHWSEAALDSTDGRHLGRSLKEYAGTGVDMLGGKSRREPGLAYPGNRLPIMGPPEALGHPAAYPVKLPLWFVPVYSEPDTWWLDPFLGSGTTLMACAQTGRRCVGIEESPGFVGVTLQRWVDSGGLQPVCVQPKAA